MDSQMTQICLGILKREDVKNEVKALMSPLADMILVVIYPYIYIALIFVCTSFLLHLGIFTILLRKKYVWSTLA